MSTRYRSRARRWVSSVVCAWGLALGFLTQAGALLARTAFQNVKKRLDYSELGGAPLLGAKQLTVICHGSSTPKAIRNAIRIAKEFYKGKLNESIEEELSKVAVGNS